MYYTVMIKYWYMHQIFCNDFWIIQKEKKCVQGLFDKAHFIGFHCHCTLFVYIFAIQLGVLGLYCKFLYALSWTLKGEYGGSWFL